MTWRIIEEGEIPSLPLGLIKSALRIHHDADDPLLRHLTLVAKQYIETYTQMILGSVRLEITLDYPVMDWITLPIGPFRALESVNVRKLNGKLLALPLAIVRLSGHQLKICSDIKADQIQIIGSGGINSIPPLVEGTWLNLVKTLYESETPDMSIVHAALRPISNLRVKTLV